MLQIETAKLKELTGKRTIRLAKIELGRMLALAYSAAYDGVDFGLEVASRWQVVLDDANNYSVSYKGTVAKRLPDGLECWSTMTIGSAYRLVTNPATLMLRAGSLGAWQKGQDSTLFHKRIMMLPWIDPNAVDALIVTAVDGYMVGEGRAMFNTSKDDRLKPTVYNKAGDKMLIETGHVSFDRQTNSLSTGNFWANTMHGGFIRPFQETFCNGFRREPGHLQEFDLEYFKDIHTPRHVLEGVRKHAVNQYVIFYAFYHWYNRRGRQVRVVHGYILTDADYKLIQTWNTGPSWKSYLVMDGVLPYIAWTEEGAE